MISKGNDQRNRPIRQSILSSRKRKRDKTSCDHLETVLVLYPIQPDVNDITVFRDKTELEELHLIEMSKNDETLKECKEDTRCEKSDEVNRTSEYDKAVTAKDSRQPVTKKTKSELKEGTLEMSRHDQTSKNCVIEIPGDIQHPSGYVKAVIAKHCRQPEMNEVSIHRRKSDLRTRDTGVSTQHMKEEN